jgi:hypothetical protein
MNDNLQPMKILAANFFSWAWTLASLQVVADVLNVFVLVASLAVSSVSCWWIVKQAKNLDRINRKDGKENNDSE